MLIGYGGNDQLLGGGGDDFLNGADGYTEGEGEVDILTGGPGADRFILGTTDKYYKSAGANDRAEITDFNPAQGDRLQFSGKESDYVVVKKPATNGLFGSVEIYFDRNHTGAYESTGADDLVAVLQNYSPYKAPALGSIANFVPYSIVLDPDNQVYRPIDLGKSINRAGNDVVIDVRDLEIPGPRANTGVQKIDNFKLGKDRLIAVTDPGEIMITARTKFGDDVGTGVYLDTNHNGILDLRTGSRDGAGDFMVGFLKGVDFKVAGDHFHDLGAYAADVGYALDLGAVLVP